MDRVTQNGTMDNCGILTEQRDVVGGTRHCVGNVDEEQAERQQRRDADVDLLRRHIGATRRIQLNDPCAAAMRLTSHIALTNC